MSEDQVLITDKILRDAPIITCEEPDCAALFIQCTRKRFLSPIYTKGNIPGMISEPADVEFCFFCGKSDKEVFQDYQMRKNAENKPKSSLKIVSK